jgi:hypothetical protein
MTSDQSTEDIDEGLKTSGHFGKDNNSNLMLNLHILIRLFVFSSRPSVPPNSSLNCCIISSQSSNKLLISIVFL